MLAQWKILKYAPLWYVIKKIIILQVFYKLNTCLPIGGMRIVYEALYEYVVQYNLIVWGRCTANAITLLIVQQDLAIRIQCLDKKIITSSNYKTLKVLPARVCL